MLASMSSRQFDEWRAFFAVYPVGADATFLSAAQIVAAILNTNRKKGTSPIKVRDIVPDFLKSAKRSLGITSIDDPTSESSPQQSMQDQIMVAEMLTAFYGGHDLRGEKHGR